MKQEEEEALEQMVVVVAVQAAEAQQVQVLLSAQASAASELGASNWTDVCHTSLSHHRSFATPEYIMVQCMRCVLTI